MIQKIDIDAIQFELTEDLKKYVHKKIGKLDRYLPRKARDGLYVEVRLKESSGKGKKQCTCTVRMHVPGEDIIVEETTINMFAAIDIVESKLKNQLKKYKEAHSHLRLRKRLLNRLKRRRAPAA